MMTQNPAMIIRRITERNSVPGVEGSSSGASSVSSGRLLPVAGRLGRWLSPLRLGGVTGAGGGVGDPDSRRAQDVLDLIRGQRAVGFEEEGGRPFEVQRVPDAGRFGPDDQGSGVFVADACDVEAATQRCIRSRLADCIYRQAVQSRQRRAAVTQRVAAGQD